MKRNASCVIATLMLAWPFAQAAAQAPHPTMAGMNEAMSLDRRTRAFFMAELLEVAPGNDMPVRLDGTAWIGGDYNRLWLRVDANQATRTSDGDVTADALYGWLISPFWSALAGVRVDTRRTADNPRVTRGLLSLGFEGLSPYWFEMEPSVYFGENGDLSARFETAVDLMLTQRLILQPRFEINAALQAVPRFRVGSGVNDTELGVRVRYEVRREFAPYIGVEWFRLAGETAMMARNARESGREVRLVAGVRAWH